MHFLSTLDKLKMTNAATGLFVVGAILFVIGAILLYTVSRDELKQEIVEGTQDEEGLFVHGHR